MFTDPVKNLKAFGLHENSIVADLGAGTGFYSIAAGHIVSLGKVYAVEIVKDYLNTIKNKVMEAGLKNVECFWGNIEKLGGTKIGDNVVDAVIASNILFQVEDKDTFIEEIKRILKAEGRVLLIDWQKESQKESEGSFLGPKGTISKDDARSIFEKKGFVLEREINAGAHHYGMILRKQ